MLPGSTAAFPVAPRLGAGAPRLLTSTDSLVAGTPRLVFGAPNLVATTPRPSSGHHQTAYILADFSKAPRGAPEGDCINAVNSGIWPPGGKWLLMKYGSECVWWLCRHLARTTYNLRVPPSCSHAAEPLVYLNRAIHLHHTLIQQSLRHLSKKQHTLIQNHTPFALTFCVPFQFAIHRLPISFESHFTISFLFAIIPSGSNVLSFSSQPSQCTSYYQWVPSELCSQFAIDWTQCVVPVTGVLNLNNQYNLLKS